LRDAVLLVEKALFIHLIQEATLALPGRERKEIFLALLLRPNVTHLDNDKGVLAFGAGREEYVRIQLARRAFHTIAEVPDERGSGSAVEATATE
jgi:hypothetical protein